MLIGPDEISINDLAIRIKELTRSNSPIIHIPYSEAYVEAFEDMRRRVPDTSLAKELVGFTPTYSIDQIVQSVIDYYKEQNETTKL